MPAVVIVGGHWGDEGKGKVIDLLAQHAALVVRYSGGNNAGHTVVNALGRFAMHLIPSGIFHPATRCVIGNGVALDPGSLLAEIDLLQRAGINVEGRLFLSDRAHLVMPYHHLLDCLDEDGRGEAAIGTTRLGIGPAYADKAARLGLRVGELLEPEVFWDHLNFVMTQQNRLLRLVHDAQPLDIKEVYVQYMTYAERLRPFVAETGSLVRQALAEEKLVLLEGSQGTLLDLDHGTYPFVTSSGAGAHGAAMGAGIPPAAITRCLGVFKAYTTRVGAGPFPTELDDEMGDMLRERGHEYGTTTGRPRRCGWFDAMAGRYSVELNGLAAVALVRLDVLDSLPAVKICTGYRLAGTIINRFPAVASQLQACEPVYEELPGWDGPTTGARRPEDLPDQASAYLRRLEELLGCPISIVGVGPSREQIVYVRPVL